ncbi:MAG: Arabinose efflux permease family protein [Candidatus Woesebacteria bacterium GW2011_GWA2_40_7]|uniref:Arabinose efflux permease family protein n=1 Tax=Candidatus Woesebacteria bacterium GW2011_GWA2_40_7 TaxID=1618562 RepID=A0A0G0VHR8_9BACT|nr:MAG: Arabinose efflux permease family protein [Candidatus Woesebacteria bacterium GW2011_GWA2_40_7]
MENKALKILFVFNGLFVFAGSLLGPLYAVFVERITKGIFPITLSWSMFLFSTTLFTIIVAKVGDRIKEKEYLLLTGYAIRAMVWFSYIFIQNFYILLLAQFLLGIGEAAGTPAFDAIFAEHLDKGKHVNEYSEWKIITNVVLAMGTLLGGITVEKFGFSSLFLFMSILAAICFIGILFKPRRLL